MKRIIILLIAFTSLQSFQLMAQIDKEKIGTYIVERRPNSEITNITRKNNTLILKVFPNCKSLEIEKTISFEELYSKVFTKEKVEILAKNDAVISMYFVTDFKGNIIEIAYKLVRTYNADSLEDLSAITLSEINKLEELVTQCQFHFSELDCPNREFITFSELVRFRYVLNYMENRDIHDVSRFPALPL